jgi:hypothetical protein
MHTLLITALTSIYATPYLASSDEAGGAFFIGAALFLAGPLFFGITYARYRNRGERHYHERETPVQVNNLQAYDTLEKHLTGQRSRTINGANSTKVEGTLAGAGNQPLEAAVQELGSLLPGGLGDQLKKLK